MIFDLTIDEIVKVLKGKRFMGAREESLFKADVQAILAGKDSGGKFAFEDVRDALSENDFASVKQIAALAGYVNTTRRGEEVPADGVSRV